LIQIERSAQLSWIVLLGVEAGPCVAIDDGKKPVNESAPERERAALAQLIEEYQQPVGSYLFHLIGESDVALTLTQETFVSAYREKTAADPTSETRSGSSAVVVSNCHAAGLYPSAPPPAAVGALAWVGTPSAAPGSRGNGGQ
jgi:hypothetical protein